MAIVQHADYTFLAEANALPIADRVSIVHAVPPYASPEVAVEAVKRAAEYVAELRSAGKDITHSNIGNSFSEVLEFIVRDIHSEQEVDETLFHDTGQMIDRILESYDEVTAIRSGKINWRPAAEVHAGYSDRHRCPGSRSVGR